MKFSKVLILDFGSQVTKLIARNIRELNVYCEIIPYKTSYKKILDENPDCIILSGSPASIHDKKAPIFDKELLNSKIPILGICYGAQLLSKLFNSDVKKSKIREFIYKKNRSIAIPLGAVNKYFKIKKAEEAMLEELGRNPTPKEISKKIGIAETQIINLKQSMTDSSSLDQNLSSSNEEDLTLADLIKDDSQDFVEDIESSELNDELLECVNNLNEREKYIVSHRFGLFGSTIKTLDEIGREHKLTKERVRQIQEASLSKIKLALDTGKQVSQKNSNLLCSETEHRKEVKANRHKLQKVVKRVKKSAEQEEYWDSLKGERFNLSSI